MDEKFQGLHSNRANRLILTPAGAPSVDAVVEWSTAALQQSGGPPEAVVFSGLHLFESSEEETWRPYLAAAHTALQQLGGEGVSQHLELASLSNEALTKDIVATLFPAVGSIGLNEEELGALFYALGGSYDDLPPKLCNPKRDAEAKRHRILRWKIVKKVIKLLDLDDMLEQVCALVRVRACVRAVCWFVRLCMFCCRKQKYCVAVVSTKVACVCVCVCPGAVSVVGGE